MGKPASPWRLDCPWCDYYIVVFARGATARSRGAGEEAAERMRTHACAHGRTWREFLVATRDRDRPRATLPSGHA